MIRKALLVLLLVTAACTGARAGEADVTHVEVKRQEDGRYRFDVTVRHEDQGWEHYADRWEVLSPGGEILATRVLLHPHVEEQPFTRSLSGVEIPEGVKVVEVRAHDSVHGHGGRSIRVPLPGRTSGTD